MGFTDWRHLSACNVSYVLTITGVRKKAMAFPAFARMLVMVSASFASVTGASELAPVELVATYLRLTTTSPDHAEALLAADAAYVVFDYGGPMTRHFPEFVQSLRESGCSKPILQTEGTVTDNTDLDAEVVRAEWNCAKPPEGIPASTVVRFMVRKQKIFAAMSEDPPGYRRRSLPL